MNKVGGNLHNALSTGGGKSSSLLHDERHWSSLVQKTKLSGLILGISGVSENSSVEKGTVNISNHGSNVTGRVSLSALSGSLAPCLDGILHWLVPLLDVSLVEGDDGGRFRDLYVRLGKDEFTNFFIEGEHVYSVSEGQYQEGGGGIQAVCSSNELGSRLEGVGEALSFSIRVFFSFYDAVLVVLVYSDDGSGGDSSVYVGGSIKRIENDNIFVGLLYDEVLVLPGSGKLVLCSVSNKVNLSLFHRVFKYVCNVPVYITFNSKSMCNPKFSKPRSLKDAI